VIEAKSEVQRRHFPLLGEFVEATTPTEKAIEGIWRCAFSMDVVGTTDCYEDLGGDSLLAETILSELATTFKIDVPMDFLGETSTIRQQAEAVDKLLQRSR
jgi:acyl carrier protein